MTPWLGWVDQMPTRSPRESVPIRREVRCGAKARHTHLTPGPPRTQPPSPLCWGDGARLLSGPETVLLSEQRSLGAGRRLAMEPMSPGPASPEPRQQSPPTPPAPPECSSEPGRTLRGTEATTHTGGAETAPLAWSLS